MTTAQSICRDANDSLSRSPSEHSPRIMSHIDNVESPTDRLVIKVMGYRNYKDDAINDYVEEAKEKMLEDDEMRVKCLLQPKDTIAIYKHGASIKVLAPQAYREVDTLDVDDDMFSDQHEFKGHGEFECAGLFYEHDGNAVSGSGSDVWYKVSDELIEFCTGLDEEARAISTDVSDNQVDFMKMRLEAADNELVMLNVEIDRTNLLLDALLGAKEQKEKEIFSKKQTLAKRKVALVEANAKAENAAKKQRK